MIEKETEFDFTKEIKRKEKANWSKFIASRLDFVNKNKSFFIAGLSALLVVKFFVFIISDSPEVEKSKLIALQTAAANIPLIVAKTEKNKGNYDDIVNYIVNKEYDIKTNSMKTMQTHVKSLLNLNVSYKKIMNEKEENLKIIDKKLKETKNFSLVSKDERAFLLTEYERLKTGEISYSKKLEEAIEYSTTTDYDQTVFDKEKLKELKQIREEIKKEVTEMKKRSLKK